MRATSFSRGCSALVDPLIPGSHKFRVTFEPGARTNWHYHKGGQVLLVTEGKGLYQEKGKPVEIIEKGKVVKCPPNTAHWHGASPTEAMTHIAIGTNTNAGGAVWLDPVTDKEYHSVPQH